MLRSSYDGDQCELAAKYHKEVRESAHSTIKEKLEIICSVDERSETHRRTRDCVGSNLALF